MGEYKLKCLKCKKTLSDRYTLRHGDHDALLRTEYQNKKFTTIKSPGIWKFHNWLPINGKYEYCGSPVAVKSKKLGHELGLKNLYISFNGYFPEIHCKMMTCTFKELEAPPTIQRAMEKNIKRLVVASAGNTARAFAYTSNSIEIYLVVPEFGRDALWLPAESGKNVHLIMMSKDFDYCDAIKFSERLSQSKGFTSEGGARNVARRDGMGTVLLDCVSRIKRIPDHYFQAVGSGTGAIAIWESALRLRNDGRFGANLPKLHLAQNSPFIPIVNAWSEKRRTIIPEKDMPNAEKCLREINANVLSNRNPPYGLIGGVYDALKSTNGITYSISNKESNDAGKLFESLEEIDVVPAAKVAVGALIKSVDSGAIKENELVLLNITGCGEKRLLDSHSKVPIKPEIFVKTVDAPLDEILNL